MPPEDLAKAPIFDRLPTIRGCDGCTLCCKVVAVRKLGKPAGVWCKHCRVGTGCGIYSERPQECADYECGYLVLPGLGAEWKPSLSRLILSREVSENRLNIHVDPGRPDAWRKQPYYAKLKQWAEAAMPERGQVTVMIGERTIVILPEHDVDLGTLADDEMIAIVETRRLGVGFDYEAYAVPRETPLGEGMSAAEGKAIPLEPFSQNAGFRGGKRLA
jgi:hypothetical protein